MRIRRILVFIFLLLSHLVFADVSDWYKIKTDKNGCIYVLGIYNGRLTIGSTVFGDTSYNSIFVRNLFIAKFDSLGNNIWADSITGDVNTNCYGPCPGPFGLAIDKDDNVIISLSGTDVQYKGQTYVKPNILKLDSAGNLLWDKKIRQYNYCETDVTTDGTGNIYFSSVFDHTVTVDQLTMTSNDGTSQSTFVAKLDPQGNMQWLRPIESSIPQNTASMQECYFISADSIGNTYVGGMANGTVSLGTQSYTASGFYPFLAKLDKDGNSMFARIYPVHWILGTAHSFLINGATSHDGDLFLCGKFRDSVDVGSLGPIITEPNVTTLYVAKTDTQNGDALWFHQNHSTTFNWTDYFAISTDNNKNIYAIGSMADELIIANDTLYGSSAQPTFFSKFDSSGNHICYHVDSSRLLEGATGNNNYFTLGVTTGLVDSFYFLNNSLRIVKWDENCAKVWEKNFDQKVMQITSVSHINKEKEIILFYPNPVKDNIVVDGSNLKEISIVNIHGQIVHSQVAIGQRTRIDASFLMAGIYFIVVKDNYGNITTGKIIKE